MGTSLTGLTPATTYDALIKVGDNGPLTGSLKTISDGLGNDSTLSLSTGAASIGGTLAVTGASTFNGLLSVNLAADNTTVGIFHTGGGTANKGLKISTFASVNDNAGVTLDAQTSTGVLAFATASTERMRITSAGNVGIGVSDPNSTLTVKNSGTNTRLEFATEAAGTSILSYDRAATAYKEMYLRGSVIKLNPNDINRVSVTADGLTFNGDTAAANALDDYEEGTWTMGVAFAGGSTGVTYSINSGAYTKIGRQVTVTGYCILTSKGSSTGNARITGLPFTIAGATSNYSPPTLYLETISFANQFQGFGVNGSTTIALYETTEAGAVTVIDDTNFSNNSAFIISFTYFV